MEMVIDLSESAEKWLDSAQEDDVVDPGTYLTLKLWGRAPEIEATIGERPPGTTCDNRAEWEAHHQCRRAIARQLRDLANTALIKRSDEDVGAIAYVGLDYFSRHIVSMASYMAAWTFEDAVTGGAALPFFVRPNINRRGHVCKRTARRLMSRSFINRAVSRFREIGDLRETRSVLVARAARVPCDVLRPGFIRLEALLAEQRKERQRREWARFNAEHYALRDGEPDIRVRPIAGLRRSVKIARRNHRTVIRRSAEIAAAIVGTNAVSRFSRGEPITIEGRAIDLSIARRVSIGTKGHGALDIDLHARGGPKLASLCLYVEDVPALDQVAGLALHLQSGEELDILSRANITYITEAGLSHPVIAERSEVKAARDLMATSMAQPRTEVRAWTGGWPTHEQRRSLIEEYWKDAGPMWVERLAQITLCKTGMTLIKRMAAAL